MSSKGGLKIEDGVLVPGRDAARVAWCNGVEAFLEGDLDGVLFWETVGSKQGEDSSEVKGHGRAGVDRRAHWRPHISKDGRVDAPLSHRSRLCFVASPPSIGSLATLSPSSKVHHAGSGRDC